MKKIKYLLGLLIVGVGLFINQSFAGLLVDYQSTTNRNLSISLYCRWYSSRNYRPGYFAGSFSLVEFDQGYSYFYDGSVGNINNLNFSDYYYITGGLAYNAHYCTYPGYLYSNGDSVGYVQTSSSNGNSYRSYYYRLTNPGVGFSESDLITFDAYNAFYDSITTGESVGDGYLHVLSNDNSNNCFNVNTPYDGNCYSSQFEYHPYLGQLYSVPTITDQGPIYDAIIDGLYFNKGGVAYSIYNTYSFIGVHYSGSYYDIIAPRTVFRKNETTVNFINGVYYTRLNNTDPILIDNQSFSIVAFYGSGSSNSSGYSPDANVLYSIYNCPYNADSVFDCTFDKGGYVYSSSNLVSFGDFFWALYIPSNKGINVFDSSSNTFSLIIYDDTTPSSSLQTYSFSLGSNEGFDINNSIGSGNDPLPPIPDDPDDPEDSTYSGSVVFDNCIETEVCWYSTGSDGLTTKYCTNSCVSSGAIESGSYIGPDGTIYYVDSTLDIGNLINGNTSYLFNTGYLDSDGLLSVDYYSGLFNGGGFKLGVCPYPKSEFFSFVTNIKIGGFYPFMPINCFYSAFIQGFKIHYFDDFGLFPDLNSQLINGNTHFHKTLFRFFDILLSIGLLLILTSLYRMIKK